MLKSKTQICSLRLYVIKKLTPARRKTSVVITASISSEPSAINKSADFLPMFAVYFILFDRIIGNLQFDRTKCERAQHNTDMYN